MWGKIESPVGGARPCWSCGILFPLVSLLSSHCSLPAHPDPGCARADRALFNLRRLSFEVQRERCWAPADVCEAQEVCFLPLWARENAGQASECGFVTSFDYLCDVWDSTPRPPAPNWLGRDCLRSKECPLRWYFFFLFFFLFVQHQQFLRDVHKGAASAEVRPPPTLTDGVSRAPWKLQTAGKKPKKKTHEESRNCRFPPGSDSPQHSLPHTLTRIAVFLWLAVEFLSLQIKSFFTKMQSTS